MNGRKRFGNKYLLSAIVAAMVVPLIAISASFAQPGMGGHRGRHFGPGAGMGPFQGLRMLRQLNLSDEQRQEIRGILQKARESGAQKQLMDARKALQDAVESPTFDEQNILSLASHLGEVEGTAAVERAQIHQQILQILTDEQRQELEKMQAEAKQQMEERMQRFQQRMQERANKGANQPNSL